MFDRYIKIMETIFWLYFRVCNYVLESICMMTPPCTLEAPYEIRSDDFSPLQT